MILNLKCQKCDKTPFLIARIRNFNYLQIKAKCKCGFQKTTEYENQNLKDVLKQVRMVNKRYSYENQLKKGSK